ncbi:kinase-like domain-containing protein [Xylaria cf. heliscus]|nr:kinase-like domain-containing protein [Xylaria cf. heliscus]
MSSYTPITLPYFAPANVLPAPLPPVDQVLSSRDYLVSPIRTLYGKDIVVVRIGEHFVAKYGGHVRAIEGENMLFVKEHTTIPVPQVYAIYTFGKGKTMIIMSFVKGKNLRNSMMTMSPQQLEATRTQLKAQVNQLRQIPAPGYYGSIGRRPLRHAYSGSTYGPFDNFGDMIRATFDLNFDQISSRRHVRIKESFLERFKSVSTALGHTHPVFTHGDLHEENIIIQSDGTPCIIDYEVSGFYPAFHERLTSEPLPSRVDFLDEYPDELEIAIGAQKALLTADIEESDSNSEKSHSSSESSSTKKCQIL